MSTLSAKAFIWLDKISSLAASLGLSLLGSSLLRFDSFFTWFCVCPLCVLLSLFLTSHTRRFLDAMWWVIWSSFITSWRRIVLASLKSERMPRYFYLMPLSVCKVPFTKIHKYANWSLNPWYTLHLCSDHVTHVELRVNIRTFHIFQDVISPGEPRAKQIIKQRTHGEGDLIWILGKYQICSSWVTGHKIQDSAPTGPLIENCGDLNLWNFLSVNEKIFRFSVISRPGNFVVKLYFKYQMSLHHTGDKRKIITSKNISNSF